MNIASTCPNCQRKNVYKAKKPVSASGGYGPNFLPGLGQWFRGGRFEVVVCHDCGLTRFFTFKDDLEHLDDSNKWERLGG